ncbi:hypothetical protein [Bradyrhizobium australafricanum]|uniref:hypothetical protein n=1 Tax=Bradyrhizobium australafricanum TaxID=2821406 RepID=UPI001CE30B3C|nr:hypothetical protein [Bradyrhizobium australafricanum]MCA6102354.1 hypothetical protein [Bradyrhizobium australafricanum]
MCDAFASELGGELTEIETGMIRQAAGLTLRGEQLQAAIVRGEAVANDEVIRIAGASRRILADIAESASKRKRPPPTLQDRLRQRAAERAGA